MRIAARLLLQEIRKLHYKDSHKLQLTVTSLAVTPFSDDTGHGLGDGLTMTDQLLIDSTYTRLHYNNDCQRSVYRQTILGISFYLEEK